ncbi:MAG: DUF7010 family protein [Spirochaetales bacterium]
MTVSDAQLEVRTVFLRGAVGQAVSAVLWAASAAFGTWGDSGVAMAVLFFGGMLIFPLTQLALRLAGRPGSLSKENPFTGLAMQTAFIIPLCIPVIFGATLYNTDWFYPAFMVVVGAHYLPFITLYGMWQYGVLAAGLIFGGVAVGLWVPGFFSLGGWAGAGMLLLFALVVAESDRTPRTNAPVIGTARRNNE